MRRSTVTEDSIAANKSLIASLYCQRLFIRTGREVEVKRAVPMSAKRNTIDTCRGSNDGLGN
ncbi:putative uncharacterized protein [Pseudomonas sp. StFLB209]|uniref:hypothetical protein n=1 Tax=Pseudomonas sp. StFLB209 TaxID=1028989 RepID=UPI0004F91A3C|nr:hypothetical protein [Pseudomonas sp. StFLB209]BAP44730.1 putative uncharacterized protein [Pseudomonas sp. StFLB209]